MTGISGEISGLPMLAWKASGPHLCNAMNYNPLRGLVMGLGMVVVSSCSYVPDTSFFTRTVPVSEVAPTEVGERDAYGMPIDAYEITTRDVRRNETLGGILADLGYDAPTASAVVAAADGVFNVRRIAPGNTITQYIPNDPATHPTLLVYSASATEYVVFQTAPEIKVSRAEREVEVRSRQLEGEISGSLYETLMGLGATPALAVSLSEVFAWQIDFYRIQRGDRFTVLFEEETLDGKSLGVKRITSATFTHIGKEYTAFHFEQDGRSGYFDIEGNSLKKAFLKAPLAFSRISSRFTNRRFHPILRRNIPHHGTDYAAPSGTPIRAVGDAVVLRAGYDSRNGNWVKLRHNGTYETGYLHMSRIAPGVRAGSTVSQGQIIGYVGSTGLATGPHLCYRFWVNGQPADPYRVETPNGDPVAPEHRAAFMAHRTAEYARLTRKGVPALALMPTFVPFPDGKPLTAAP